MSALFPTLEPFAAGRLPVDDLHTIYYEQAGNPHGRPVLFLHGGPGVGILPDYRRFFDPRHYHIVLVDQRGAGRSTPPAELRDNTTWNIVADLELLRERLQIEHWILFGGSWGSLLAMCYAIRHPRRIAGIILRGVFLGRQSEVDWVHRFGMSELYPEEWERYQALVPASRRNDMVRGYYELLTGADEALRVCAAAAWSRWEAAAMCLIPDPAAVDAFTSGPTALAIGRIECHFTLHKFFLPVDNYVLENAATFAQIPGRIVQGRYDVICPVRSAWDLHRVWPASRLTVVPDGSHSPMDAGMAQQLVAVTEELKSL